MNRAITFSQPMRFTGIPNTSSWAGYDFLQITQDGVTPHPGLDYNYGAGEQDKGLPINCIANGYVEKVISWDGKTKGFGNHVFIKHILEDDTVVYSHYAHLDSITCQENTDISKGDEIGKCGGSGGWPSHLHLEIRLPIGKGYEFWPKGMSREWVAANYFDPYGFIEKRNSEKIYSEAEMTDMRLQRDREHNEGEEYKQQLEGSKAEIETLRSEFNRFKENYTSQLQQFATILGSSDDTAELAGKMTELVHVEDNLREAQKKIEQLKDDWVANEKEINLLAEIIEKKDKTIDEATKLEKSHSETISDLTEDSKKCYARLRKYEDIGEETLNFLQRFFNWIRGW